VILWRRRAVDLPHKGGGDSVEKKAVDLFQRQWFRSLEPKNGLLRSELVLRASNKKAMRIRCAAFAAFLLTLVPAWAADYVPGELLVGVRGPGSLASRTAPAAIGAQVVQELPEIGVLRLRLPKGLSVERAIQQLRGSSGVVFAEPNYLLRLAHIPNDPMYPLQWNLPKISSEAGWDVSRGSSSVLIAIVDTGADLDHPDLAAKLVQGYDFVNGDSVPEDDHGHGSHVAGIAASATNNAVGIAGVGYDCRLLPIKSMGSDGTGSTSDVAAGVNWAVTQGAKVVCLSLGSTSTSSTMSAAVSNAWNNGVLVVAAAGNDGSQQQFYPAAYPNAIAVGASDSNDQRASFSNFGAWVDVAAPGTSIRSTYRSAQYAVMDGTSMAAPHVAGLGGLLWAHLGLATNVSAIRSRIENNVVPVGTWVAKGRIDVRRALLDLGPPATTRRAFAPATATLEYGSLLSGNFASLLSSDDNRLDLLAERVGSGRRISYRYNAFPIWQGQLESLEAFVELHNSPLGIVQISLWNWNLARWDVVGTRKVGTVDRQVSFQTTNTAPYLGAGNEVFVQVVRTESRNRPFWLRTDKVEVATHSFE
jgi:thermitase